MLNVASLVWVDDFMLFLRFSTHAGTGCFDATLLRSFLESKLIFNYIWNINIIFFHRIVFVR